MSLLNFQSHWLQNSQQIHILNEIKPESSSFFSSPLPYTQHEIGPPKHKLLKYLCFSSIESKVQRDEKWAYIFVNKSTLVILEMVYNFLTPKKKRKKA